MNPRIKCPSNRPRIPNVSSRKKLSSLGRATRSLCHGRTFRAFHISQKPTGYHHSSSHHSISSSYKLRIMSDSSIRGLSTKIFYADRYCETNPATSAKTAKFYLSTSVWSSSSLHTSISQVVFSLSVDGTELGTMSAADKSWDPGQGASYQLTFLDPALTPSSLPLASNLVLAITAQVTAGIAFR